MATSSSEQRRDDMSVRAGAGAGAGAGTQPQSGINVGKLILALLTGAAFVLLTLPDGMTALSQRDGWDFVSGAASFSVTVNDALAVSSFDDFVSYITIAVAAYLGMLILLAVRHSDGTLLGWGIFTLIVSTIVLHAFAWVGFIIFVVAAFIFRILGIVFGFLFSWVRPLVDWLKQVFIGLADSTSIAGEGSGWFVLFGIVALIAILAFAGPKVIRTAARVIAVVALGLAALYLLGLLFEFAGPYIAAFFVFILVVVGLLLAFLIIGQLFFDQLRSALIAGNGRLGVIVGAMTAGTVLALLMLVGNVGDAYSWYPGTIAELARNYILQTTPHFDAAVTLLVVSLCVIGVVRNLPQFQRQPTLAQLGNSAVYAVLGMIVGGALAGVAGVTED